ncbi:MAG TPA: beta-eliminating lyase-related protein, partial [Acidimicrobiales bacterium]|nr:beta-eliminating lyase-related protein [Acidimicrobiales bacterium]
SLDALARVLGDTPLHMDGARLFNAVVATGISAADYTARATTVMSCLSKGLCAPVGSLLAGPAEVMARARVERKRLGGAMRQAGVIAAAGLVALETMVDRLADDHRRAKQLAAAVAAAWPDSHYDPTSCATNIVAFRHERAGEIVGALAERGVLGDTLSANLVRLVTHHDVTDDDLDFAIEVIGSLA